MALSNLKEAKEINKMRLNDILRLLYKYLITMIVNKLTHKMLLQTRVMMRFSGGHHHHVYDWRDDHTKNPDFF